jgi:hypothetical protein
MALGTQFRLAYAGPGTMTRRIIIPTGMAILLGKLERDCRPVSALDIWN